MTRDDSRAIRDDSRCTEVYEVREAGALVIRTRDESLAIVAYDTLVRHNKRVEMFVGIEGDGHGPHDFQLTESFEPEEVTQPFGRPEVCPFDEAYDRAMAEQRR
jgi:hypothetical protein